jgi:hypothetical protein
MSTASPSPLSHPAGPAFPTRSTPDPALDFGREVTRLGGGLLAAAAFGLALGAHGGGPALVQHAVGAALALLAVTVITVPSLLVLLALLDAPLTFERLAGLTARAVASSGLLLAGLAPAAALLVVTIQSAATAALVARAGLTLALVIGAAPLLFGVYGELQAAPAATRFKATSLLLAFSVFAVILATRLFEALLPILDGGLK